MGDVNKTGEGNGVEDAKRAELLAEAQKRWESLSDEQLKAQVTAGIDQLEASMTERRRAEMVLRLRAEVRADSQRQYDDGRRQGAWWAGYHAPARQLKRLRKEIEESDGNGTGDAAYLIGVLTNGHNAGLVEGLYAAITGDDDGGHEEAASFWSQYLDGDQAHEAIEDEDFARGFIEGALEEWQAVANAV